MALTYYEALRLSPRYRAAQRHAAQQCEQARRWLAKMQAQAILIEKRLSPIADEPTILLPAIRPCDFEKHTEGRIPARKEPTT